MSKVGAALLAAALAAASAALLCAEAAVAQQMPGQVAASQTAPEANAQTAVPQATPEAAAQADANCPGHPDALGTSRVLALDPAKFPRVGHMQYPDSLPLNDKEVVLTFDDGPWPGNTPSVLKTLENECTTGIFFPIGKHATYEPELLKKVYAAGHTIGSHTWSHANLNNKKLSEDQRKEEIEKGLSAIKWALGGISPAPFFRFPALQHPPEMVTYLGTRNTVRLLRA